MSNPPVDHPIGKVLELYPGSQESARRSGTTARSALDAFLASAGWTLSDLTPDQVRLVAGLFTERQLHLETIETLNRELEFARTIADHDPLVPVYNRRAFLRELGKQISFCERYNLTACLIYMDLDNFKALNDQFGHSAGDEALKDFGRLLKAHTRASDLIGRLGGDEFAVLLLDAGLESAKAKADRLREDVQAINYGTATDRLNLDVSCGVVEWQTGDAAAHLVERADEAMFIVKHRHQKARA